MGAACGHRTAPESQRESQSANTRGDVSHGTRLKLLSAQAPLETYSGYGKLVASFPRRLMAVLAPQGASTQW